jgi:hypothetical protein
VNYDQQLEKIKALGIDEKHIRRVRYHTLEDGRSVPVCELDKDDTMQEKLYRVNAGRLDEGEFWILRYYDEQGIWREVVGSEPRELSTPAEFFNQMLSELRMYGEVDKLEMLPKALEMLSKAIELNLQGEDHPRHKIKATDLIGDSDNGYAVVPAVESLQALRLAFEAGELMERFGVNYRGVMDDARKGVGFSDQGGVVVGLSSLKEWEQEIIKVWLKDKSIKPSKLFSAIENTPVVEWDKVSDKFSFDRCEPINRRSALAKVERLLKRVEGGKISVSE